VLNKVKSYYVNGGYRWLADALDFKRYIKSLHELLPHVSSTLKQMALPVLKNKLGDTQESLKLISIGSAVKPEHSYIFAGLHKSKNGIDYTTMYVDINHTPGISMTYITTHGPEVSKARAQIDYQGASGYLPNVFGKVIENTIYCIEIDIDNLNNTYINNAETVYKLIEIADSTIETVQYDIKHIQNSSMVDITEVGPKTLPLTTQLVFFGWEKADKYIDSHQQQDYSIEPKATEDKSGANINSDLDYTDKMIDSMSSGTEGKNLNDDYYEKDY
jgi:hypothetical protein